MPESYFMGLVGAILAIFILVMVFRAIFERYPVSLSPERGYRPKEILIWALKNTGIIKRLTITAGILVILRLLFLIPLPGVDLSALQEIIRRQEGAMFPGAGMGSLKVFGFGLVPFFSSCMAIQFLSIFIPKLRRLSFAGESGRERIAKYTYILSIFLCALQAYFISRWLENPANFYGGIVLTMAGWSFRLVCMVTMTAAFVLLLFIAGLITRYGIGNGVAVIYISSFPLKIFAAGRQTLISTRGASAPFSFLPFLLILVFAGLAYVIFAITNRSKVIKLEGHNSDQISIPLRPTIVGLAPIEYAQNFIILLITMRPLINSPWVNSLYSILTADLICYIILVVLVIVLTYAYAWIVFDSKYVRGLMKKYGYALAADKEQAGEDYIDKSMSKFLIITAAFLVGVSLTPNFIMALLRAPYLAANLIGSYGLVVAVGVFSDMVKQLEFYRKKQESEAKDWSVCYIAFDEIEAGIKAEYLKSKGILALVEPLRFTWGLPIRTMVDQYRIYTPASRQEEARGLIRQNE